LGTAERLRRRAGNNRRLTRSQRLSTSCDWMIACRSVSKNAFQSGEIVWPHFHEAAREGCCSRFHGDQTKSLFHRRPFSGNWQNLLRREGRVILVLAVRGGLIRRRFGLRERDRLQHAGRLGFSLGCDGARPRIWRRRPFAITLLLLLAAGRRRSGLGALRGDPSAASSSSSAPPDGTGPTSGSAYVPSAIPSMLLRASLILFCISRNDATISRDSAASVFPRFAYACLRRLAENA
jgi:hypothetical protein